MGERSVARSDSARILRRIRFVPGELLKRSENAHRCRDVKTAVAGASRLCERDLLQSAVLTRVLGGFQIVDSEAEAGKPSSTGIGRFSTNQASASAMALRSCSVSGSSSIGALAMARETGSSIASRRVWTAATLARRQLIDQLVYSLSFGIQMHQRKRPLRRVAFPVSTVTPRRHSASVSASASVNPPVYNDRASSSYPGIASITSGSAIISSSTTSSPAIFTAR